MVASMNDIPSEKPPPSPYCGMTTNERLYAAGLIDGWDIAALSRNRRKMIELLMAADVLRPAAEHIVDAVLAYPEKYGF